VLLTVIQPPFDLWFLGWVAFVPVVLACAGRGRTRSLALAGYIVSLLYWLGNLYWIVPITITGWVVFGLYTALLWPVLVWGIRWCLARRIPLILALPVLVVGIERMQGLFMGGFLWRLLGHSQYRCLTIVQIADIFGAGGVSFLVAMVNGLIGEVIIQRMGRGERGKRAFVLSEPVRIGLVVAAVVGAVVYGRWRIGQSGEFIEDGPMIASLQSCVPQSLKRSFAAEEAIFEDLMEQSRAVSAEMDVDLIIWPETMVQGVLDDTVWKFYKQEYRDMFSKLDSALKEHAKDNAYLLVGAYGANFREIEEELRYERFNSAYLYRADGTRSDKRYDKIHLVPFGEVLPFRRSLPWVYNILKKFTPKELNYDYSLDYGSEYTVFEMDGDDGETHKFAVIICYEDVTPYIGRRFSLDENGNKQVDWLINISNDGWFVGFDDESDEVRPSTELAQHAAICVFRAVENRLSIVRSVNTGISCIVDSVGRIRDGFAGGTLPRNAMERTGMAGWFADKMPIDKRATFYSKYGPWLDFCCKSCVLLFIIVSIFARVLGIRRIGTILSGKSNGM
jgi:apolipoprotein N-acyltransferase